jgi:hypothetical protein
MPTPNEREIYLGSWCRTKAGSAALADLIAQYRESIIASEREAAADRWELLIYWAFPWGKYTLAELRVRASEEQLKEIAEGRAVILSGQSASPKESSESIKTCETCASLDAGCPGADKPCADYWDINSAFPSPTKPATPLQEARDDSDDWMQKAKEYMENGGCPVCFATDEDGHTADCEWGQAEKALQEARDRGERLEALVSERVALYEGTTEEELEMVGLGWVVRARAALAAEGKA